MRICFLPKRREKREEMVRPMAVVALAMGTSKRGLGRPRAFSFYAPGKPSEERAAEEERRLRARFASRRVRRSSGTGGEDLLHVWQGSSGSALNLRLCHVTRQPRRLRQRPGPSNADRFASPPPHPPELPALREHCACAGERLAIFADVRLWPA